MQEIRHNLVAGGSTEGAEPIQGHLEKKEALLDELSNWFENVSEENFDEAALDELLDSLQEVDPLESSFDPVASREAFCR